MLVVVTSFVLALATLGNACMCMLSHPQPKLCAENSFVALVKIRSQAYVSIMTGPEPDQLFEPAAELMTVTKQEETNQVEYASGNKIVPTASMREIVLNEKNEGKKMKAEYIRYRIKLYKAYKGIDSRTALKEKFYVYTPLDDSMCGTKLTVKGTFLIIGTIMDGRLTFGLCSHVIEWKTLPSVEKKNIRSNMYAANSICDAGCNVTSCLRSNCEAESSSECTWNKNMERQYGENFDRANFLCAPGPKGVCQWSGVGIATIPKKFDVRIRRRRRHSKHGFRNRQVASAAGKVKTTP